MFSLCLVLITQIIAGHAEEQVIIATAARRQVRAYLSLLDPPLLCQAEKKAVHHLARLLICRFHSPGR